MTALSSRNPPAAVAWLGYGGLLPFAGLAVALVVDPARAPLWLPALLAYGAVILSFVGALHWGVAMVAPGAQDQTLRFVWSVVPSLLGWGGLLAAQVGYPRAAAVALVVGLVAHWGMDLRLARKPGTVPAWYLPLRLRLTAVASVCLLWAAAWSPA